MKKNIHGSEVRRRIIVCLTAVFLVASIGVSSAFAASVYFKSIVNSGNRFVVASAQEASPQSAPPPVQLQSSAQQEAPVISEPPQEAYAISYGYRENKDVQVCTDCTVELTYNHFDKQSMQQQVAVVATKAVSYMLSISALNPESIDMKYKAVYLDKEYKECDLPETGTVVELAAGESMIYYIDFINPVASDHGGQVILKFDFID